MFNFFKKKSPPVKQTPVEPPKQFESQVGREGDYSSQNAYYSHNGINNMRKFAAEYKKEHANNISNELIKKIRCDVCNSQTKINSILGGPPRDCSICGARASSSDTNSPSGFGGPSTGPSGFGGPGGQSGPEIRFLNAKVDTCKEFPLEFNYYNITSQLCNLNMNIEAKKLNDVIKTVFPDFDIQSYFKFNNSIIKLDDTHILMSYRIYISKLEGCSEFDLGKCHYWNYNWATEWDKLEKLGVSFNHIGLCIIDTNTFKVIQDTILTIHDKPSGFEDVRLFENNDTIYVSGNVLAGWSKNSNKTGKKQHIARQAIAILGKKSDIINKLPNIPNEIEYDCLNLHGGRIEKNWFGYVNKNNEHIIVNPTFGNFFPLNQSIIDFNKKEKISDLWSQNALYDNFKKINAFVCNPYKKITERDTISEINNTYAELLKNPNKPELFRLSGGSWGIPYENNTVIFIGHIVVYPNILDLNKVSEYVKKNPTSQITKNLMNILANRKNQISMRYYQIFFKINYITNKLEGISHAFNIFKNTDTDTSINFPMGLVNINNTFLISFGESDYNACIISLQKSEIDKLFTDVTSSTFKLLTYDGTAKQLCYTIEFKQTGGKRKNRRSTYKRKNRKNRKGTRRNKN